MAPIQLRSPSEPPPPAGSWYAPGAGVTPNQGHDYPTSMWVFSVSLVTLATYNALELVVMILITFKRYRGVYFYSMLVSSLAVIPYTVGFFLNHLSVTSGHLRLLAVTLITVGWWPMVTGQALVLWSRLHLIVFGGTGERVIWWTKWMIIFNVVVLHLPTTGELLL